MAAGRVARRAPADVVHSQSPLLIPTARAALRHHDSRSALPVASGTQRGRDAPRLPRARAGSRAARGSRDRVVALRRRRRQRDGWASPRDRVTVCSPARPTGRRRSRAIATATAGADARSCSSARSSRARTSAACSTRTRACATRRPDAPPLVLAGGVRDSVRPILARRVERPPLAAHVTLPRLRQRRGEASGSIARPRCSCCRRSTKASACRSSRRWRAACRSWSRIAARCRRLPATRQRRSIPTIAEALAREMARLLDARRRRGRDRARTRAGRRILVGRVRAGRRAAAYRARPCRARGSSAAHEDRRRRARADRPADRRRPLSVGAHRAMGGRRRTHTGTSGGSTRPPRRPCPAPSRERVRVVGGGGGRHALGAVDAAARARARIGPDVLFAPGYTAPLHRALPDASSPSTTCRSPRTRSGSRRREGARRRTLTAWSARRARLVLTDSRVLARRDRAAPRHPGGRRCG